MNKLRNILHRLLWRFRKIILGYEIWYGVDYAVGDKDYTCHVKGKRLRDGTIVIEDVEYLSNSQEEKE